MEMTNARARRETSACSWRNDHSCILATAMPYHFAAPYRMGQLFPGMPSAGEKLLQNRESEPFCLTSTVLCFSSSFSSFPFVHFCMDLAQSGVVGPALKCDAIPQNAG